MWAWRSRWQLGIWFGLAGRSRRLAWKEPTMKTWKVYEFFNDLNDWMERHVKLTVGITFAVIFGIGALVLF